ncbi:hypothetical protein Tco_0695486 [Tanacetum coccineum]
MTIAVVINLVFKGFFEKQKLTRPNFIDWYKQLRIVLLVEDKLNYLEQPIPPASVLPKGNLHAYEMLQELKTLFAQQVEQDPRVSLILISLRKEFDSFVQNYNMHSMGKTINELHPMIKLHEQTLPKKNAPALHAIRATKGPETE